MLIDGVWTANWQPVQGVDAKGGFVRQTSSFRHWVTPDGAPGPTGEGGFKAEAGRYHLYVALICPWATRALITRKLKKLEDATECDVFVVTRSGLDMSPTVIGTDSTPLVFLFPIPDSPPLLISLRKWVRTGTVAYQAVVYSPVGNCSTCQVRGKG